MILFLVFFHVFFYLVVFWFLCCFQNAGIIKVYADLPTPGEGKSGDL